jgi:hypothetical protein
LKRKNSHIEVRIDNTLQHIYYDDSLLLKQLRYFPYIQLGVIFIFLLIGYLAFSGTKKAEQNQVWVGLSKKPPINWELHFFLLAWLDLLKSRSRQTARRNGKDCKPPADYCRKVFQIGSTPDLQLVKLKKRY